MAAHQTVTVDHDDRVQDNDMRQKHDFRLGTIGAEEVPSRPSGVAGNVFVVTTHVSHDFLLVVLNTAIVSSVIDQMICRPSGDYYLYIILASIQLLYDAGQPFHFTKASVRFPTFRRCRFDAEQLVEA